jgi:hypothetical protein
MNGVKVETLSPEIIGEDKLFKKNLNEGSF